jgi:hypothetical protein
MSYNVNEHINREAGFFKALFDTSFTEWVTLRVAGVLYVIALIASGLASLWLFGAAWGAVGPIGFLLFIIGVPLSWILQALLWRLVFEAAIATIAIAKNTEALKK